MKRTILAGALAALTVAAAGVAVAQQGPAQPQTPRAMRADADGDGRISQAEFVGQRVERLTAVDANSDGAVAPEEMRAAFQARSTERADARFQRMDANSDGAISRAEFDAPRAAPTRARGEGRPQRARQAGMHRGGARMAHRAQRGEARGPISITEAQGKAEQAFTRLDADHDGFVTVAERQAGMHAVREQRRGRMTERRAARQAQRQASPPASASE